MNLDEILREQQRRGAVAYEAVDTPGDHADRLVAGIRRGRRRRHVAQIGVATLAMVGFVALTVTFSTHSAEPADIPPGTVVWSTALGAQSWSSPALVTESLIAVAADDGVVRGLDVKTGAQAWSVDTAGDVRAALEASDGVVFASSEDGSLYAISATGTVLWETAISSPTLVHDEWRPLAAAPLAVGDLVCLGDRDANVTCVDSATGAVGWVASVQGRVSAQAASDGIRLYVGADDARLYAFDVATGEQLWTAQVAGEIATPPAVAHGIVVVGNRGTEVVGMRAESGEVVWRVSTGTSWAESAPVIADGVAYFGSSLGGHVSAVDVATGTLLWRTTVGGLPWARPSVSEGEVYVTAPRTEVQRPWLSSTYALDRATGAIMWTAPGGPALEWRPEGAGYGAGTAPLVVGGLLVVVGLDGVVYGLAR
jgi:outer membrane protein assembly factor BamB